MTCNQTSKKTREATLKMLRRLSAILLLFCASAVAQSTLTIPADPTQPGVPVPGEDTAAQLNLSVGQEVIR